MSFWDEKIEFIDRHDLEKLQLERLQQTVARALRAPYYRRVLGEKGITADSVTSLDHIRDLPFTTKEDLRTETNDDFLAVPMSEVVRVHVSSGTTGTPTSIFHSQADIDAWSDLMARCLCMAGMTKNDVFQNMTGYGLFTGGLGLHYGAERLGALVIPAGTGNSRRQLMLMKRFGTTAIHIIPSYALKLLDTLHDMGVDPKKELNLRLAVIGAEPHSSGAKKRIEDGYGVRTANSYGLSEMNGPGVGFECPHQTGLHIWEDNYILEVIDPSTLEPVEPGVIGEVVMTTLKRQAMPLLRYRTRDLAMIIPEPCPCGRTHRQLSRIKGRADDMLILKGVNIFPIQVERVLMDMPETGQTYLILLDKEGSIDTMTVQVEMGESLVGKPAETVNKVASRLTRLLRDEILISPKVELVAPGALPSSEGKAVRVIDRRPPEDETA